MSTRGVVVAALGTSQTLAWASSYYLPAILADDVAAAAGVSRAWVFGAFSAALLLTAVLGPWVGRLIDRRGGRGVLAASNVVFALGLGVLGVSNGIATQCVAWAVLGAVRGRPHPTRHESRGGARLHTGDHRDRLCRPDDLVGRW